MFTATAMTIIINIIIIIIIIIVSCLMCITGYVKLPLTE